MKKVELNNTFAIGCIIQWYEVEVHQEYIKSIINSINNIENKENVIVDIVFYLSENLETIDKNQISKTDIKNKFKQSENLLKEIDANINIVYYDDEKIYTIADYRREFNDKYCDEVDVLMWGETDSLIPEQTFEVLDLLHTNNINQQVYKYLAFFGGCKMWDDSWKPVEHTDFTDKPFIEGDDKNWWSLRYNMSIDEMNSINNKVTDLDVRVVNPYKFNGCGLIISSDIIKSGVNIPKSIMLAHEDTAFQNILNKFFNGTIPQFVFKNLLLVHNRKHSKKRMYVLGEDINEDNPTTKRESNSWYQRVWEKDRDTAWNGFSQIKIYDWKDIFKKK